MWENIVNPKTAKKVNVKTKKGQQIINRYISHLGGSKKIENEKNENKKLKKMKIKKKMNIKKNYEDLPVAKVVSYHFPDGVPYNTPINIDAMAEIYGEEEEEILILLNTDEVYLKLATASDEQEKKVWSGEIEKPQKPNVTVFIQNRWCFNPKWTNKTDEHGRQLLSCDTPDEVKETEEIYKTALKKWNKIENGATNYINTVIQKEQEKKKSIIEDLFYNLKDGDIIEDLNETDCRTTGMYIIRNGIPQNLEENQSFPTGFSLGPKYPVGYWINAKSQDGSFDDLPEPVYIEVLEKLKKEDFIEKEDQYSVHSVVYFDWGALSLPYPKNDVVREIKNLKGKHDILYFQEISRGIAKLVFPVGIGYIIDY